MSDKRVYSILALQEDVLTFYGVESSNLESVAYVQAKNTLYVVFKHGTAYAYPDVTLREFGQILADESHGKAFHRLCVATKRPFRKIEALAA